MRLTISVFALFTLTPATSFACAMAIETDAEELAGAIRAIKSSDVGLDGTVIRGSDDIGSVAIIKPKHIWYGDKRDFYYIRRTSDCDKRYKQGSDVEAVLYKLPPRTSKLSRFWDWVRGSTEQYDTSGRILYISSRLQSRDIQQAITLRRRRPAH